MTREALTDGTGHPRRKNYDDFRKIKQKEAIRKDLPCPRTEREPSTQRLRGPTPQQFVQSAITSIRLSRTVPREKTLLGATMPDPCQRKSQNVKKKSLVYGHFLLLLLLLRRNGVEGEIMKPFIPDGFSLGSVTHLGTGGVCPQELNCIHERFSVKMNSVIPRKPVF